MAGAGSRPGPGLRTWPARSTSQAPACLTRLSVLGDGPGRTGRAPQARPARSRPCATVSGCGAGGFRSRARQVAIGDGRGRGRRVASLSACGNGGTDPANDRRHVCGRVEPERLGGHGPVRRPAAAELRDYRPGHHRRPGGVERHPPARCRHPEGVQRRRPPVASRYVLPGIGTWNVSTTLDLVERSGRWLVQWSPSAIDPALRPGSRLVSTPTWAPRAPILGSGGAPLTGEGPMVSVGVEGSRIKDPAAVSAALLAAGATAAEVQRRVQGGGRPPDLFRTGVHDEPRPAFEQLGGTTSALYQIAGTVFQPTTARTVITPGLAAHLVGTRWSDHRRGAAPAGLGLQLDQHGRPNRPGGRLPDAAGGAARRRHHCGRCRRQDRRHGGHLLSQARDGRRRRASIPPFSRRRRAALAPVSQYCAPWWRCGRPPARSSPR